MSHYLVGGTPLLLGLTVLLPLPVRLLSVFRVPLSLPGLHLRSPPAFPIPILTVSWSLLIPWGGTRVTMFPLCFMGGVHILMGGGDHRPNIKALDSQLWARQLTFGILQLSGGRPPAAPPFIYGASRPHQSRGRSGFPSLGSTADHWHGFDFPGGLPPHIPSIIHSLGKPDPSNGGSPHAPASVATCSLSQLLKRPVRFFCLGLDHVLLAAYVSIWCSSGGFSGGLPSSRVGACSPSFKNGSEGTSYYSSAPGSGLDALPNQAVQAPSHCRF